MYMYMYVPVCVELCLCILFIISRSLWLQGAKCVLQQSQTEVKLDFPLPVIARNLIVEFSDFYENAQVTMDDWYMYIECI